MHSRVDVPLMWTKSQLCWIMIANGPVLTLSQFQLLQCSTPKPADQPNRMYTVVGFETTVHPETMNREIYARIRDMFDVPQMQNNLRGLWVEAMVCEILGSGWKHTGSDWAAWDLEREDGLRVEVKQSAKQQSWGTSTGPPRFGIAAGSVAQIS
ncbi:hypothetical protein [Pseudorhodobacter antarcticus]|uniref:hypothetical protein n=1 Tax=Pseudorhodobacter antarcticus TaxID=1077947 RepID=UPI0011144936|nr:hypothetical protein [Pseudorhodobacter antarcticus]